MLVPREAQPEVQDAKLLHNVRPQNWDRPSPPSCQTLPPSFQDEPKPWVAIWPTATPVTIGLRCLSRYSKTIGDLEPWQTRKRKTVWSHGKPRKWEWRSPRPREPATKPWQLQIRRFGTLWQHEVSTRKKGEPQHYGNTSSQPEDSKPQCGDRLQEYGHSHTAGVLQASGGISQSRRKYSNKELKRYISPKGPRFQDQGGQSSGGHIWSQTATKFCEPPRPKGINIRRMCSFGSAGSVHESVRWRFDRAHNWWTVGPKI